MFWSTLEAHATTESSVDSLFAGDNVDFAAIDIYEALDKDDIIQEAKSSNEKLLEYLTQERTLSELIKLITVEHKIKEDEDSTTGKEPPHEEGAAAAAAAASGDAALAEDVSKLLEREKHRFKYPNTACELLNCDVPQINAALARNDTLIEQLCKFFEADDRDDHHQPLVPNPLLASYVIRVFSLLIWRHTRILFDFFRNKKPHFVDTLLQHIRLPSVVVLFLHLASATSSADIPIVNMNDSKSNTTPVLFQGGSSSNNDNDDNSNSSSSPLSEDGDVVDEEASSQSLSREQANEIALRDAICEWLDSNQLIEKCIDFLDAEKYPEPIYALNASQLLCDLIRLSREQQLLRLKESDSIEDLTPTTYASALLRKIDSDLIFEMLAQKLSAGNEHATQAVVVSVVNVLEAPFEIIPIGWDNELNMRDLLAKFSQKLTASRIERCVRTLTTTVLPALSTILLDPPLQYASVVRALARMFTSSLNAAQHQQASAAGGGVAGGASSMLLDVVSGTASSLSMASSSGGDGGGGGASSSEYNMAEYSNYYYRTPVGQARIACLRLLNLMLSFDSPELHDAVTKCQLVRAVIDMSFRNVVPANSFLQRELIQFIRLIAHFQRVTFFQHQAQIQQQHAMQFLTSAPDSDSAGGGGEHRRNPFASSRDHSEAPRGMFSGSGLVSSVFDYLSGGAGGGGSSSSHTGGSHSFYQHHGGGGSATSAGAAAATSSPLSSSSYDTSLGGASSSLDHGHQFRASDDELPILLRQAVIECNLIQRLCDLWRDIEAPLTTTTQQKQQSRSVGGGGGNGGGSSSLVVPVERGKRRAVRGFLSEVIQELTVPEIKHQLICAALRSSTLRPTRSSASLSGAAAAAAAAAAASAANSNVTMLHDQAGGGGGGASDITSVEESADMVGGETPGAELAQQWDAIVRAHRERLENRPRALGGRHPRDVISAYNMNSNSNSNGGGGLMLSTEAHRIAPGLMMLAPTSSNIIGGDTETSLDADAAVTSVAMPFISTGAGPSCSGSVVQTPPVIPNMGRVMFSGLVPVSLATGEEAMFDDAELLAVSKQLESPAFVTRPPRQPNMRGEEYGDVFAQNSTAALHAASQRTVTFSSSSSNSNSEPADAGISAETDEKLSKIKTLDASDAAAACAADDVPDSDSMNVADYADAADVNAAAATAGANMAVADDPDRISSSSSSSAPINLNESDDSGSSSTSSSGTSATSSSGLDAVTINFPPGSSSSSGASEHAMLQTVGSPLPAQSTAGSAGGSSGSGGIAITKSASAQRYTAQALGLRHQRQPSGGNAAAPTTCSSASPTFPSTAATTTSTSTTTTTVAGISETSSKHSGHDDALTTSKKPRQQQQQQQQHLETSTAGGDSSLPPTTTTVPLGSAAALLQQPPPAAAAASSASSSSSHHRGFDRQISTIDGQPLTLTAQSGVAAAGKGTELVEDVDKQATGSGPATASTTNGSDTTTTTSTTATTTPATTTSTTSSTATTTTKKPSAGKRLASFFVGHD